MYCDFSFSSKNGFSIIQAARSLLFSITTWIIWKTYLTFLKLMFHISFLCRGIESRSGLKYECSVSIHGAVFNASFAFGDATRFLFRSWGEPFLIFEALGRTGNFEIRGHSLSKRNLCQRIILLVLSKVCEVGVHAKFEFLFINSF